MSEIDMLVNRLRKNARHWGKWARRYGITCYRLYERDIPEFPVIIDYYEGQVHLQEVDTGWQMAPEEHAAWMQGIRQVVAEVLEIPQEAVFTKIRRRQKGLAQYEKVGGSGIERIVHEGGHQFYVNLQDYLDTGLFLDHRHTRQLVQERAAGKRFLNLFAYTGSFTVYAAAGGARASVTVDLSNTYQEWTQRNLELNGIDLARHQLVRQDVFAYLADAARAQAQFDLIVMDPPSFSNSKKMAGVLDIQRDHVALINAAMRLLSPHGEFFFSTNLRSFQLDPCVPAAFAVEEISARTVPEDFRNKRIHLCWLLQHHR